MLHTVQPACWPKTRADTQHGEETENPHTCIHTLTLSGKTLALLRSRCGIKPVFLIWEWSNLFSSKQPLSQQRRRTCMIGQTTENQKGLGRW